jgi:hypothetical protein
MTGRAAQKETLAMKTDRRAVTGGRLRQATAAQAGYACSH